MQKKLKYSSYFLLFPKYYKNILKKIKFIPKNNLFKNKIQKIIICQIIIKHIFENLKIFSILNNTKTFLNGNFQAYPNSHPFTFILFFIFIYISF